MSASWGRTRLLRSYRRTTALSVAMLLPLGMVGVGVGAASADAVNAVSAGRVAAAAPTPAPPAPAPAAAAAATGCGYGTGGQYASTICWLDMTSYDDTQARTAAGQDMTVTLPGGYTLSYNITTTKVPGPPYVSAPVLPVTTPIEKQTDGNSRFAFGSEAYRNIPGKPSLYSQGGVAGTKGLDVTLSGISLEDSTGAPVTSFAFVATDTEDNVAAAGESLRWTSDKELNLIEALSTSTDKGCQPSSTTGLGTTTVNCTGLGGPSSIANKSRSILVSADAPTNFALRWITGAQSGIAFGVQTSSIEVVKKVDGRAARTDSFDVSLTSPSGSTLATATTDTANTATTGPVVVIPPNDNAPFTLTDAITPGSGTNFAEYTHTWSCTRNGVPDPSLPSGEHTTISVPAGVGDQVVCTVTNKALPRDRGDAPASYGTLTSDDGPVHKLVGYDATAHTASPMLGAHVDDDADGVPGADANGDDTAGIDDEDGIAFASDVSVPGRLETVFVTSSGAGFLNGWIDFNRNGSFDVAEQIFTDQAVVSGVNRLAYTVPSGAGFVAGATTARFRLTSASGQATSPIGAAPNGEVEDYRRTLFDAQEAAINSCPIGSTPVPVSLIQNPSFESRTQNFVNAGSGNTINFAQNWFDSHPTGGQYFVFSPTFDSGPASQTTWPWRAGADGYGFLGGHTSTPGNSGEGASNTLAQPLVANTTYVGFFSIGAGSNARNGSGYMRMFGVSDKNIGSIPNAAVVAHTATNSEPLFDTPVVSPAPAGTREQWKLATFTLKPTKSWNFLRVEARNADPNGNGTVAGQAWMMFDDFHLFSCEAAPDFGDAPASYGTIASDSGAVHKVPGYDGPAHTAPLMLGPSIDADGDGQPTVGADGDDTTSVDDEDGVTFNPALGYPNPTIRSGPDPITLAPVDNHVTVNASAAGFASVWVDWNIDGDFADAGERVADAQPVTAGANDVTFSQGTNPPDIRTYVRVRYSTDAASIHAPTGAAPDGEVEDYQVLVERLVSPAACSPVTDPFYAMTFNTVTDKLGGGAAGTSARYPNVSVVQGEPVDMLVQTGNPGVTIDPSGFKVGASGDDAGWNLNSSGQNVQITYTWVKAGTTTPVSMNSVWTIGDMDTNERSDYIPDTAVAGYGLTPGSKVLVSQTGGRLIFAGTTVSNNDVTSRYQVWFQGKSSVVANWRGFNNSGFELDGDGDTPVPKSCDDYGDAPDASYKTMLASDGPHHTVTPGLRLGADSEFDADGQPNAAADGDDTNRNDDEDGVPAPIVMTAGEPTVVDVVATNTTGGPATLAGWLDLDGDSAFGVGERVVLPVAAGTATYPMTFPAGPESTTVAYARFRLFPGTLADPLPTGAATAGEVEDYRAEVRTRGLTVTKSSDATVDTRAGDTVTYTVTATNTGSGDFTAANPARVIDDLAAVLDDADYNDDAAAEVGPIEVADPTYTEPRLRWEGPLLAGQTVTITYTVTLNGGGDGTVRNVAWAAGNPPGPTPDCDDPAVTVSCAEEEFLLPKLSITKRASRNDLPMVGQDVTYTVTVRNDGPGTYTDGDPATFVDDLSAVVDDADFVAGSLNFSSGTASFSSPEITWSGALAPGGSAEISYTFTYNAAGDHILLNAACVPAAQATNPDDPCVTVTTPGSGLDQEKSASPSSGTPVAAGDKITYTLRFTNTGEAPAAVDTTDDLSDVYDDATLVDGPNAEGGLVATPNANGFAITGPVPVGETLHVSYTVQVKQFPDQGNHLLTNLLACQPGDPPTCEEDRTEHPVGGLLITKTSDATADARPGDVITYTVTAENVGAGNFTVANPAVVLDALSNVLDDADYNNDAAAEVDGTPAATPVFSDPRLSWSGPLASGETVTITYSVTLTGGGDGDVENVAFAPGCNPAAPGCDPPTPDCVAGVDPDTGLPCDTAELLMPKLSIRKSADPVEVGAVGDVVTYTVVVTNEGPGAYTAGAPASFADNLTDVLDDATLVAGSITETTGDASFSDPELSWDGVLAAGDDATITYQVSYTGTGNHSLVNAACVPTEEAAVPAEDCATVTTAGSQLTQTKTSDPADGESVGVDDEITYTLTFTNDGDVAAVVDTTDDLSDVLDDATLEDGPNAQAGLTATPTADGFAITGSVPPGESRTVTYTVRVSAGGTGNGVLLNSLACQPGEPPTCEPETTEHPVRELKVTKTSSANPDTRQGDVVTYTVTAENVGGDYTVADPAVVVDDLAGVLDDATYNGAASATIGGTAVGDPSYLEPVLSWTGPLASGETVTITYTVTLKAGGDGNVKNVAWAPNPGDPPGPTPDCDDPATTVPCDELESLLPRLSITKESDPDEVNAVGETVTFTVNVTNDGPGDYTAGAPATFADSLTDVLDDAGFVAGSITATRGDASFTSPTLSWTGALTAGQSATITYQVRYTGAGDHSLVNAACVPEAEATDPAADCATVTVLGSGLVQTKTSDPASGSAVAVGDQIAYTLTFTNTGSVPATVDTTDNLAGVLDDATLVAGPTAQAGLTATPNGNLIAITGSVPAGESRTVTYSVAVKALAQQGDHVLRNALACQPGAPAVCVPNTTEHPVGHLTVTKTSGATAGVDTGDKVTYTIVVRNDGVTNFTTAAPATVVDDLSDVLDDATYDGGGADVGTVSLSLAKLTWTGALAAGQTATITYTVTVTNQGDHDLRNTATVPGCSEASCSPPPVVTDLPYVVPAKTAKPASGSVQAGDLVTYTLSWTNSGKAAGVVDATDDLSDILDDAVLVGVPASSSSDIIVTRVGDTLRIVGPIDPGETVTVTYQVRIRPDGQRGNNLARNVLVVDTPQVGCTAAGGCDPVDPPDTETPVGEDPVGEEPVGHIRATKSVNRPHHSEVKAGDRLRYTLRFTNTGRGPARVDYIDDLADVLDDAVLVAGPTSSHRALKVKKKRTLLLITGKLRPGRSVRVTYTIRVRPDGRRGNGQLDNFLFPDGDTSPAACVKKSDTCTDNVIAPNNITDPGTDPADLPSTGASYSKGLVGLASLSILLGCLLMIAARRRRRAERADG